MSKPRTRGAVVALAIAAIAVAWSTAGGSTPARAQSPGGAAFTGAPPNEGIALLVATTAAAPADLAHVLADTGCDVESLALLEGGAWDVYIPGAFAQVNAGFPPRIEGSTPFFVRCRAAASAALDAPNATYTIEGVDYTLVDGLDEREAAPGSASMIVTQLTGHQAYGDLDGDATSDAGVVLVQQTGGSGSFYHLAALTGGAGGGTTAVPVLLGDRIVVERLTLLRGRLTVSYLEHGPDEPFATPPTVPVTREFELVDGALVEVSAAAVLRGDSGSFVNLDVGETFQLVLEANPSTGYVWEVDPAASASNVLEQVGEPSFVASSPAVGSGGKTTFTFRATADGAALLNIRYRRPFEPAVAPLRTFEVNVSVGP